MILVGSCFEVLGVGAIFPVVTILSDPARIVSAPVIGSLYFALGQPPSGRFIALILFGLVSIYLIKNIYLAWLAYWLGRFSYNKQAALSQRLFGHYLAQPYTFHLQHNTAELIQKINSQVPQLIGAVVLPVIMLFSEVLTSLALIILLLSNNLLAGSLLITAFCVASIVFYRVIRARLQVWGERRQYHDTQALLHVQQGLGGIKDSILFGSQGYFEDNYRQHSGSSAMFTGRLHFINALPLLWLETLAVASLLGLVVTLLLQGISFAVVVPTLGLFTAAAFRMMPSVNRILVALQNLRFCKSIIDTLFAEMHGNGLDLDKVEHRNAATGRDEKIDLRETIRIADVHFTYPGSSIPSLQGVSLEIRKGESVGIIGPSGSGKTTLVDVILGLLRPNQGDVYIDSASLQTCAAAWQRQIGYVAQSIYLTDGTLRSNVAFGLPDTAIDDASVWRALDIAQLSVFVRALPEGLGTVIGERGIRLSGGQRQRIGIARAVYHDPQVLVFDEATSALDHETEAAVVAAIEQLRGQKTMIVIAHRLTTVANCDRVVRLAAGKIVPDKVGQS